MALARQPAVFIDKDGTLVSDVPYNVDPDRIELGTGAKEALAMLQQAGYALVVVSNQSGVGRGLFPETALGIVEEHIRTLLSETHVSIDAFYWCTHGPNDRCACRKPAPGMLRQAEKELRLDLDRSWIIGDILNDVEAGHRAGCRSILLNAGNETEWMSGPGRDPEYIASTLIDAAEQIIRERLHGVVGCLATPTWTTKLSFDRERLAKRLADRQQSGERIVLTNGCFDILHAGHVRYLSAARALGDALVVGLNSDEGVRRLKGEGRPVNRLLDRAEVLAGLSCVDHVVPFDDQTACELVRFLRPDIYTKGGDYTAQTLPEAGEVERYGGAVRIMPFVAARSTSALIERIRGAQ